MQFRLPHSSTSDQKLSLCPLLIGRAAPLESLEQRLEQTRQRGQIVLLGGEAGIGKSRLILEFRAKAQQRDVLTFQADCYEQDRQLPFAPFIDLLQNYIATHPPQARNEIARELYHLLPEYASRAELAPPSLEPEQYKKLLFQSLLQFLTNSQNAPRLVILEDVHWSDDTSLDFLLYLARQLHSFPLLLLLTYRTDEINPALNHVLAELERQRLATEITLAALTRADIEDMIRAIFELPQPVRGEFLERIYALTEGNPFFVEETLQSLVAYGEIYFADGQWERKPIRELNIARSIQDAVQRRTDLLDESAQQVLALAAVAGRRFDFGLVQAMTRMSNEELVLLIKQWLRAQLVVEESADQFAFRHALTRETVYASLLRRERREMHLRVAETLEQLHATTLDAYASELAYHFHAAEVWAKALVYAQRAGEQAQQLYAPREAIEQFSRALEAAEKLSAPLAELLHARGQQYETIGEFERARADYDRAREAAQHAHDAKAEWQAFIDLGFLWASRDYTRAGNYFQDALTLARAMQDSQTLAHTLNRIGNWYVNLDQPQPALDHHHEALTLFRQVNDRSGIAETLDLLGLTNEIACNLEEAHTNLSEAVGLFRELGNQARWISSLTELSSLGETYLGSAVVTAPLMRTDMLAFGEQALGMARQIGLRSAEAYAQALVAQYHSYYGEYDDALKLARNTLQLTDEIEHTQWNCFAHNVLGWLYRDLLTLDAAQQHCERAVLLARQIGSTIFVQCTSEALGTTYIAQNNLQGAADVLQAALGADPFDNLTYTKRIVIAAWGELALAQKDAPRALEIVDEIIRRAVNLKPDMVIPRLWLLRGSALTQLKRFEEAEHILDAARATAHARGVRPLLWRIARALGKLYQLQDRRKEADQQYAVAREIVQTLADAISDAALRENYLRGAHALLPRPRPLTTRRADKTRFGGLTTREREIAAWIAVGKSNREIADGLVLSDRTVATHIANILNKLTFTSRTQIAVWAVEHGLASEI